MHLNRIYLKFGNAEKCMYSTLRKEKHQICINLDCVMSYNVACLILFHFSVKENVLCKISLNWFLLKPRVFEDLLPFRPPSKVPLYRSESLPFSVFEWVVSNTFGLKIIWGGTNTVILWVGNCNTFHINSTVSERYWISINT